MTFRALEVRQIVKMGFQRMLAVLWSFAFAEAHVIGNDDPVRDLTPGARLDIDSLQNSYSPAF
jgi:hypothetical protein